MKTKKLVSFRILLLIITTSFLSCTQNSKVAITEKTASKAITETPEYFFLFPEVEKAFGYSHAVKIGNDIKISRAESIDDKGNLMYAGSMELQMKNCYADLKKILKYYGCTFDDFIAENVFTTNMAEFIYVSGYMSLIYKRQFPTGTWFEVKDLT